MAIGGPVLRFHFTFFLLLLCACLFRCRLSGLPIAPAPTMLMSSHPLPIFFFWPTTKICSTCLKAALLLFSLFFLPFSTLSFHFRSLMQVRMHTRAHTRRHMHANASVNRWSTVTDTSVCLSVCMSFCFFVCQGRDSFFFFCLSQRFLFTSDH
jgi:hypothetical protein